jgi:hypothetical protein
VLLVVNLILPVVLLLVLVKQLQVSQPTSQVVVVMMEWD